MVALRSVSAEVTAAVVPSVWTVVSAEMPQELSYIYDVLRYIVDNIGEDLRLEILAKRFFISRNKLMQDFRLLTHRSLHSYIRILRVAHAKKLMAENLPLSIIAQKCGCTGVSSLVRLFREMEGGLPGSIVHPCFGK